jgi:hypothetical protein
VFNVSCGLDEGGKPGPCEGLRRGERLQNGLLMAGRIASVRCDPQVRESRSAETQSLLIYPVVDVLAGRILIKAVAFLDFAF